MYSTCTTSVLPQGFHGLTCLPGQCRMTTGQWFHWRPRRRNHSEDGAKPLPGLLMRHLIINWQPVRCDLDLGLFQRYRPGANLAVQVVFDEIFLMKAWFRARLMYLLLSTGVFSLSSLVESFSSTLLPIQKAPSSQASSISVRVPLSPLVYANIRPAPLLLSYHTRNLEAKRYSLPGSSVAQTQNHTALLLTIPFSLSVSYFQISNDA